MPETGNKGLSAHPNSSSVNGTQNNSAAANSTNKGTEVTGTNPGAGQSINGNKGAAARGSTTPNNGASTGTLTNGMTTQWIGIKRNKRYSGSNDQWKPIAPLLIILQVRMEQPLIQGLGGNNRYQHECHQYQSCYAERANGNVKPNGSESGVDECTFRHKQPDWL